MATHLIDKSAFVRLAAPAVRAKWEPVVVGGRLAVTGVGILEILFSVRSSAEFRAIRGTLDLMPRVAATESIIDRALDVQGEMAGRGTHRAPSPADLVLAACAEVNGLTVLHYDKDFDLIADVTGQAMEWIAPAGSL